MKRYFAVFALMLLAPLAVSAQEDKQTNGTDAPSDAEAPEDTEAGTSEEVAGPKPRRRRGRRGGRRRTGRPRPDGAQLELGEEMPEPPRGESTNEG